MRKLDPIKHEKKRQELLAAAKRCFLRSGLRGASTAEICAEAGISPGHLYHYFDSKDAIVAALAEARFEDISERFKRNVDEGRSIVATLLSEMDLPLGDKGPAESAVAFEMFAESTRNPGLAKIVQGHSRSIRRLTAEALRYGQARGEVDPSLDPETAAAAMLGLEDGLRVLALVDPKSNPRKVAALFRLLANRLLCVPTKSKTASPTRGKNSVQRSRTA
jgi:TetR/AcrR family transcriptional repressor of uid operon